MTAERDEQGFALAALIIFLTAAIILLAAVVPAYRLQAQRELEEELIFRGQEYVRAIQKYQRQFGIFPPTLDALLETNGIPYLRKTYTDPIAEEEFRLLTVNPDGTIEGSSLFADPSSVQGLFQGGTPQSFGSGGSDGRETGGQNAGTGGRGSPGLFPANSSQQPAGADPTGVGRGAAGPGQAGTFGQAAPPPGEFSGQASAGSQDPNAGGPTQNFGSGGIVGVAPQNEQPSLKVYNQREIYSEWEFIALPGFGTVPAGQTPGQVPGFTGEEADTFSSTQPNAFQ